MWCTLNRPYSLTFFAHRQLSLCRSHRLSRLLLASSLIVVPLLQHTVLSFWASHRFRAMPRGQGFWEMNVVAYGLAWEHYILTRKNICNTFAQCVSKTSMSFWGRQDMDEITYISTTPANLQACLLGLEQMFKMPLPSIIIVINQHNSNLTIPWYRRGSLQCCW